jgi:DNA-binding NtrC family response regulator
LIEKGERIDAILCDVMMSNGGGLDVHGYLCRTHPELLRRTIFMTGGGCTPEGQSFVEHVAKTCLQKPFDLDLLRSSLAGIAAGEVAHLC